MDWEKGHQTALTIALHRGLFLAIILDREKGEQTALNIELYSGLYLAIIMDRKCPLCKAIIKGSLGPFLPVH
jgi:hypothetical protein